MREIFKSGSVGRAPGNRCLYLVPDRKLGTLNGKEKGSSPLLTFEGSSGFELSTLCRQLKLMRKGVKSKAPVKAGRE
jgi:hypothetical protein